MLINKSKVAKRLTVLFLCVMFTIAIATAQNAGVAPQNSVLQPMSDTANTVTLEASGITMIDWDSKPTTDITLAYRVFFNGKPVIIIDGQTSNKSTICLDNGVQGIYQEGIDQPVEGLIDVDLSKDVKLHGAGYGISGTAVSYSSSEITVMGGNIDTIYGGFHEGRQNLPNMTFKSNISVLGGFIKSISGASSAGTSTTWPYYTANILVRNGSVNKLSVSAGLDTIKEGSVLIAGGQVVNAYLPAGAVNSNIGNLDFKMTGGILGSTEAAGELKLASLAQQYPASIEKAYLEFVGGTVFAKVTIDESIITNKLDIKISGGIFADTISGLNNYKILNGSSDELFPIRFSLKNADIASKNFAIENLDIKFKDEESFFRVSDLKFGNYTDVMVLYLPKDAILTQATVDGKVYDGSIITNDTTITNGSLYNIKEILIGTSALVGTTLTAKTQFSSDLSNITYQWYVNDEAIDGATNKTFDLIQNYIGKNVYVKTTYYTQSHTSNSLTVMSQASDAIGVSIIGEAKVGKTLTANVANAPDNATIIYKWFANSDVIAGQTSKNLVITEDLIGKQILVTATISGNEYVSEGTGKVVESTSTPGKDGLSAGIIVLIVFIVLLLLLLLAYILIYIFLYKTKKVSGAFWDTIYFFDKSQKQVGEEVIEDNQNDTNNNSDDEIK